MNDQGLSIRKIEETLSPLNKSQTPEYQIYRDYINGILKQIEESTDLPTDMLQS